MKNKTLVHLFLFAGIVIFTNACDKQKREDIGKQEILKTPDYFPEIINGVLKFGTYEDMVTFMNNSNSISLSDNFQFSNSFSSFNDVLQRIAIEEEKFEDEYYSSIPEGLHIDTLLAMGVEIKNSNLYLNCLENGIIKENKEKDGSISFEPTISDPLLRNVLNQDGLIIVNDTLYQFKGDIVKYTHANNDGLISVINKLSANVFCDQIKIIETPKKLKFYSTNEFKDSGWKTNGNKLRVKAIYRLYDHNTGGIWFDPISCATITHNIEVRAQEKRYFQWKTRSSYKPIQEVSGEFQVCLDTYLGFDMCSFNCSVSDGTGNYSPYFRDTFLGSSTTNYLLANLCPNGIICPTDGPYEGIGYFTYYFVIKARFYEDIILSN